MRLIACLAAAAATLSCNTALLSGEDSHRYQEDFHYSYDLKPGGRLMVENFNGSVEITPWDQSKVDISGSKYAAVKEDMDRIKIEINKGSDFVDIRSARPDATMGWRGPNAGVRYRIQVPRKITLENIRSSNGAVRVEGVEGRGRFKTSNGPIRLLRYRGDVDLETSNGPVELTEFSGGATVGTSNGPVTASRVSGFLEVRTSNAPIKVEAAKLDAGRPLRLKTSNGGVTFVSGGALTNDLIASTSNGSITIRMGDGAGARVKAHTSNGRIESELPLNSVVEQSKNSLDGTIGKGGPLLDLSTSNGSIRIGRAAN